MTTYAHAVKVRKVGRYVWSADCPTCGWGLSVPRSLLLAHRWAVMHAAICEALHAANWAAACPSCKAYGRVAPACPVCLGRGHIVEREGLE